MKKKVVVGMSGGVDSSVAACLLKEQGYDVIGVTMQLHRDGKSFLTEENVALTEGDTHIAEENAAHAERRVDQAGRKETHAEENGGCHGLSAVDDARRVAEALDIPYYVMNFKQEFQDKVINYFVEEYLAGRTPNPCNACNRYIKWEALLKRGMEIGADYIATGHYARISQLPNGRFAIRNSVTAKKDQTYALYNLTQDQLAHTLMPIGEFTKEEIRDLAVKYQLPVASKPDSQDICFVPDGDYGGFLEREAPGKMPGPGNFVTEEGTVLGTHKGIVHYTVGQRKGLGLSLGRPVFVSKLIPETNEVVISDEAAVFRDTLECNRLNFMGMEDLRQPRKVWAKIRYAHPGEWCTLERIEEDKIRCHFEKPVRAITPGQAVVFYEGEYVMGGGTIL